MRFVRGENGLKFKHIFHYDFYYIFTQEYVCVFVYIYISFYGYVFKVNVQKLRLEFSIQFHFYIAILCQLVAQEVSQNNDMKRTYPIPYIAFETYCKYDNAVELS